VKNTFIQDVIDTLQEQKQPISDFVFLLPSKRAGLFLKEALKENYRDKTLLVPVIQSIEEFITERSGLQPITTTTTLFEFYHTYLHTHKELEKESFESFTTWAQTLLHDFNEIDRYLIDHHSFFNYLSQIQDINHWYLQSEKTPLIARYISFWKNLEDYYTEFTNKLVEAGKGYQGLQYRVAAQHMEAYAKTTKQRYIFLGFNALNAAEQTIIQQLVHAQKAQVFWDMDATFYTDTAHDASLFLRKYAKNWPHFQLQKPQWIASHFADKKTIEIIGTPKHIGQANYVGELLANFSEETLKNTAIVLGDESLLLPLLNSLPENIKELNITMGLPLRQVPLASFFEAMLHMHAQQEPQGHYYKWVLELLHSQPVYWLLGATATTLANSITKNNSIYITASQLQENAPEHQHANIHLLFHPLELANDAIATFQKLIYLLKALLKKENKLLDLEYCYRFYRVFNQLQDLQESYNYITSLTGLQKLYHEVLNSETLDFRGEPFRGLQLMGMLESRCLDFENVIITAVNEGVLPAGKSSNSFLPYDLKKAYQLPTYKEKDAIYTYHFYRLLQRAKNVYLLYNTEADGLNTGEKSRFLLQLEIEKQPNHELRHLVVSPHVPQLLINPITFPKNQNSIEKLKSLAAYGFSPSALTSYIRDPIAFHHHYILGIKEEDQVEETIAANTLGTVVHNVLENYYKPFVGKHVTLASISHMRDTIDEQVRKEFRAVYAKMNITQGKNLLIFEVAKRYIFNFLNKEAATLRTGAILKIIAIETTLKTKVALPELDFPVFLKGKVDRVDELDGQLRIIDYKTGKVTSNELTITDWNCLTTDYKYSKAFQVLTYVYMMYGHQSSFAPIAGGVISFKNLKEGFLQFGTKTISKSRTKDHNITPETLEHYRLELKKILLEICNPNISFEAKET